MVVLGLADLGNIAAEFAGIASGMGIFGLSKYSPSPSAPLSCGSSSCAERTSPSSAFHHPVPDLFQLSVSAILAHPDWTTAIRQTLIPEWNSSKDYIVMIVGLIGTTVTPWMQFYLQASIVEKGITEKHYSLTRWDVIIGCIVTDVIAFFIVVACAATLFKSGHHNLDDASEAARRSCPSPGRFAGLLFAVGLVNASMLSAAILPLATAYNVCEGLGFESGIDRRSGKHPSSTASTPF